MRLQVGSGVENCDDARFVAKSLKEARHQIGACAALHMDGLKREPLGMSKHTGSEGGCIALIVPERPVDFMNAIVIDENARQVWLECFRKTLQDADKKYQFPMEYFDSFWGFLDRFSLWMVNSK